MSRSVKASFTGKLHRLFVTATALVLALTGLVVLSFDFASQRNSIINRAESFSGLTSPHLANVLATDSAELANLLLDNYFSEAGLVGIYVYKTDGSLLVSTIRSGYEARLPQPSVVLRSQIKPSHLFSMDLFQYSQPIWLSDKAIGQIYLQYSLEDVVRQFMMFMVFGLVLYLFSLIAVYFLSKRIQRGISKPIDQILRAMERVTTQQHFDIRIPSSDANGELRVLVNGFNEMLEQVGLNAAQLKAQQKAIEQHVFFDPLTGLANRRLLIQRMEREVIRARRTGQIGALLYMDLDHFKAINDSLGHMMGDSILMGVAERITGAVREVDTPARLGGDEFVVLLPELGKSDSRASHNALSVAEKVRVAISQSQLVSSSSLQVTPSIGIALFNGENSNYEQLIMQADLAMYRAKEEGRNRVQFYLENMQEHADHRQQVEERLRIALDNDALYLCYQPQIDNSGDIVGAEALVRWQDGENGLVNPAAFIPIAEMTDLICLLGRWVLSNVCQQMVEWRQQDKKLIVSINISPREFQQSDFVEMVEEIILTTGARAEYLVFELTEGVLLNDIDTVLIKMQRLSRLGIRFSLDDFGTGYSSLQYLKQLPLNALKIDQSFVRDSISNDSDAAVVATIIAMADTLNIEVVAEGVEQQEELDYLKQCGCHLYQGYFFYRPVIAAEMTQLIPEFRSHLAQDVVINSGPAWPVFD